MYKYICHWLHQILLLKVTILTQKPYQEIFLKNILVQLVQRNKAKKWKQMAPTHYSALLWATQAVAMPNNDVMVQKNWVTTCVLTVQSLGYGL